MIVFNRFRDVPVRSILKNTRSVVSHQRDQQKKVQETDDHTRITIEERKKSLSPRRFVTTMITEEYCRVKRQIIEEFCEGQSIDLSLRYLLMKNILRFQSPQRSHIQLLRIPMIVV